MLTEIIQSHIFIFLTLCFLISYFVGSIPFGLILTRVWGYGDIRNVGSGNIGATNVLRTGNRFLALIVLMLELNSQKINFDKAEWVPDQLSTQMDTY